MVILAYRRRASIRLVFRSFGQSRRKSFRFRSFTVEIGVPMSDTVEETNEVTSDTLPHPFGTCVPLGACVCVEDDVEEDEVEEDEVEEFDPSAHTVDEVKQYVIDYPDDLADVIAAEKAGKNRVTLIEWLESE